MAETRVEQGSKELRISGVLADGKDATLIEGTRQGEGAILVSVSTSRSPDVLCPVYNVLWAEVEGGQLEVSYVKRRPKAKQSVLARTKLTVKDDQLDAAKEWCEAVITAAYGGVTPKRRLRVFVNPHGGPGKARQIYTQTVEPILRAARCAFDTSFTERAKHATELAKTLSLDYDALVLLSGDGLLHEIYNGFAEHDDPLRAFAIPVAPIPTGSANGMAINLLGLKDGFDVGIACLNAIKGKPMKQDICSIMLGGQRIFSYFSVALGLMADIDLGTEYLRWMGDIRFVLGYLAGIIKKKPCPVMLEMKTAVSDKDEMVEEFQTRSEAHRRAQHAQELDGHLHEVGEDSLPVLKHADNTNGGSDEGWTTFDKPLLYFYAGSSPYMSRDLMQFPVAHASDGLIDIVAQEIVSRKEMITAMDGADKGSGFWREKTHYFKAHAYRITPHTTSGLLSIDGERYPLQPFTVECHRALGTLLSPTGHYAAEFDLSPLEKRKEKKRAAQSGHVNEVTTEIGSEREGLRKLFGCC